jgi:hypothetical protein
VPRLCRLVWLTKWLRVRRVPGLLQDAPVAASTAGCTIASSTRPDKASLVTDERGRADCGDTAL